MNVERILLACLTVAVGILLLREFNVQVQLEHVVSLVMVAGAVWLVYTGYRAYKGSSGNWHKRLFAAFSYSETIVATRVQYLIGLALTFSEWLATILGEPTVAATLQQYVSPKVSGGLLIGSAVITEICRRRRASLDPVVPIPPVTGPVTEPVVPSTGPA